MATNHDSGTDSSHFSMMDKTRLTVWWGVFLILFVGGCQRPPTDMELALMTPIGIHCQAVRDGTEQLHVRVTIQNNSDEIVHLPVTNRMPYVLMQEDESLLILYGVEPPEPNVNYLFIEIPKTQALEPNEVFEAEVRLVPLYIGGHYSLSRFRNTPKEWYGLTTVHCQVGWGETPILPRKEQNVRNIDEFMEWQQMTTEKPIQVTFP